MAIVNDPLAFIHLLGANWQKDFAKQMAHQAAVVAEMLFQTDLAERRHAEAEGPVIDGECVDLDQAKRLPGPG